MKAGERIHDIVKDLGAGHFAGKFPAERISYCPEGGFPKNENLARLTARSLTKSLVGKQNGPKSVARLIFKVAAPKKPNKSLQLVAALSPKP